MWECERRGNLKTSREDNITCLHTRMLAQRREAKTQCQRAGFYMQRIPNPASPLQVQ